MKNAIVVLCAVAATVAVYSFAADVHVATLTNGLDGGTLSNTGTMARRLDYALQCTNAACYKSGTSTPTPDCATDYVLPLVGSHYSRDFNAGGETVIRVKTMMADGGNADCHLFQRTK